MQGFSGYIAADELYDGPFCILSIVDNHTFKRLMYQVLDHDPAQADIESFFRRFQAQLAARDLKIVGITTESGPSRGHGSNLYPVAVKTVFGDIEHQICEFHILADITNAILHVVAKIRKTLTGQLPKLPRGRPAKSSRKLLWKHKRLKRKIGDLFTHRYLFVQRALTPREQRVLQHPPKGACRITRSLPQLRAVREIMDEVYGLFESGPSRGHRRYRVATALNRLALLRRRVSRSKLLNQTLKVIFSPNLDKALTFLDDRMLPATSNAVERGNRRYRKMQKSIYRVRTINTIDQRVALDTQRERQAQGRLDTIATLHLERRSHRSISC